jgi:hypothetical protein
MEEEMEELYIEGLTGLRPSPTRHVVVVGSVLGPGRRDDGA